MRLLSKVKTDFPTGLGLAQSGAGACCKVPEQGVAMCVSLGPQRAMGTGLD